MTVSIRPAASGDLGAIRDVGHRTWPATYSLAGEEYIASGLGRWWSLEALQRVQQNTTVLVAVEDEDVIGVGNIDLRPEIPIIWILYVLPNRQHAGVGSALLNNLLTHVPAHIGRVHLAYVDGNGPAAQFYARHGFSEIRREPNDQPTWPAEIWVERSTRPPANPDLED